MIRSVSKILIPEKLKPLIKKLIKKIDFFFYRRKTRLISKEVLIKQIKAAGIKEGDILFIHSSLKSLGFVENGPKDVIEAFQEIVGCTGTLILPTFTIELSMVNTLSKPNYIFDPKTTASSVGRITNDFMKLEGVKRSIHPTHSIAAWGKYADYLTEKHFECDTVFGEETPFGKFHKLNGKVIGLGISYGYITYYHVFEDFFPEKIPQVYLPEKLNAQVRDVDNNVIACKVKCHNPDFHKVRIESKPEIESFFRTHLEKRGISKRSKVGEGELFWFHAKDLIQELEVLYTEGKTIYQV